MDTVSVPLRHRVPPDYNEHANADCLSRLPLPGGSLEEACADPTVLNTSQIEALPVNVNKLRGATAADGGGRLCNVGNACPHPKEIENEAVE